ncbi:hypothetical protein MTO96_021851 [Rhipicephalus appendiculatus]
MVTVFQVHTVRAGARTSAGSRKRWYSRGASQQLGRLPGPRDSAVVVTSPLLSQFALKQLAPEHHHH